MKLSRQFTVFGSAIFCVVIFSLYLMLDRGHLDHPKNHRREGSFPQQERGSSYTIYFELTLSVSQQV
ncbi:UNVERIFIED_CONTAM: Alpha-mannosidase 2 [Gekko kuhli]